jgi:hypothetical protein
VGHVHLDTVWGELRRRHVVRVVLWYLAFAIAAIQIGDVMLDRRRATWR